MKKGLPRTNAKLKTKFFVQKHKKRLVRGKLFIITGTSAVGKTTIAKGVLKRAKNLQRSLTYTSRSKRGQEKNHQDYHFVTEEEFKKKIRKSDFLEWAINYGHYYGTNKSDIKKILNQGKNALVVIDIKGALNIKKMWPKKSLTIFILPESLNQLKKRFQKRHDTKAKDINKRLEIAKWELAKSVKCDYQIINRENKVNLAIKEVIGIIES